MDLSILIVSWNTRSLLLDCLASIYAAPPRAAFEVLVVDNASTDGSAHAVAQAFPQVRLLCSDHNLGFARANNRAAHLAQGSFLLLLNPDTRVTPGALDTLVEHLQGHARAAAAGPRLVNADGTWQVSVERAPTLLREFWRLFHFDRLLPLSRYPRRRLEGAGPHPVDVIQGACLLLRRSALPAEGVFDEDYFIYSEETDLCERLRHAGWELHWLPDAVVTHLGGQSTKQAPDELFLELYRNKVRFFRKRHGAAAAAAYKVILLLAGGTRFLLGQVVRPLRLKRGPEWARLTRLYGRLLGALPTL